VVIGMHKTAWIGRLEKEGRCIERSNPEPRSTERGFDVSTNGSLVLRLETGEGRPTRGETGRHPGEGFKTGPEGTLLVTRRARVRGPALGVGSHIRNAYADFTRYRRSPGEDSGRR
jgi:hypothetical protein